MTKRYNINLYKLYIDLLQMLNLLLLVMAANHNSTKSTISV